MLIASQIVEKKPPKKSQGHRYPFWTFFFLNPEMWTYNHPH